MASSSLLDVGVLQLCGPYQQLDILRLDVLRLAELQSSRQELVVFVCQLALEVGNPCGHLCGVVARRWQVPLPGGTRGWLEPLL
jgi:hypothetical protein